MKPILLALLLSFAAGAATQAAEPPLDALTRVAAEAENPRLQLNVLRGMNAALKGKRNLPPPQGWPALYEKLAHGQDAELRQQAQMLAVIFGGGEALADLRRVLADGKASLNSRKAALESLIGARDLPAVPALLALVHEPGPLRQPALRGLANFDSPEIGAAILAAYGTLASEEKRDALAALAMRPASARALLAAVDQAKIQRGDLSAPIARQLRDLKDAAIDTWLDKNWGTVRTSSVEKQKEIARLKAALPPAIIEKGDPAHGRALFAQTCAVCHTLFGRGGKIGPELPGAFEDIDYLLQNIIDPNAIIGKDYQQTIVQTKAGQTLVGIVAAEDPSSLTLKSLAGPVTVQRGEIAQQALMEVSLMPEGLLSAMKETDVRDLFSYLRRHGPVPMLASAANVNDFYNGADLTNWSLSSPKKWRVENGAIVGQGSADRAEFLTSELTAENFRLQAELALTGAGATAEIALRGGEMDGGFAGVALRIGPSGLALLRYRQPGGAPEVEELPGPKPGATAQVAIEAHGEKVKVSVNGRPVRELSEAALGTRTNFQFRIAGADAAIRINALKLALE